MKLHVAVATVAAIFVSGLAYGQKTSTPTHVEVVNKTIQIATQFLTVTDVDPSNGRTPATDVSPYSTVRLTVIFTSCNPCTGATVRVENPYFIDSFPMSPGDTVSRVYGVPGMSLNVGIGNNEAGYSSDFRIEMIGRRN